MLISLQTVLLHVCSCRELRYPIVLGCRLCLADQGSIDLKGKNSRLSSADLSSVCLPRDGRRAPCDVQPTAFHESTQGVFMMSRKMTIPEPLRFQKG
jgi:hypothetical protein